MLDGLLSPWKGESFRHIPKDSPFGVLDFRYCGVRADGRWHYKGQATLYLACSQGVALTEFSRHFDSSRPGLVPVERTVFSLDVALSLVLDLRDPKVRSQLGIGLDEDFYDEVKTRAYANLIRKTTAAEAIWVPTLGALDKPELCNLVVFLERFPSGGQAFVTAFKEVGSLTYSPSKFG